MLCVQFCRFFRRNAREEKHVSGIPRAALSFKNADWYVWRLLASKRLTVSLLELETFWSLDDAADAHEILDAIELAEATAMQDASRR